jgi:protein-S-isoprenylcysteine O-methyltransferase Ste14
MPQKLNKFQILAITVVICLMVATMFVPSSYFLIFIVVMMVFIGIVAVIAQIALKPKSADDSKTSPLEQKVRQYQDEQENAGWRIEVIPYDDPFKPMTIPTNGVAVVGALAFLIGFALLALDANRNNSIGLCLAIGGLFVALSGIWFKARNIRKNWEVATARCVDRELQKIRVKGGLAWCWRIICEYQYLGKEVRVTPTVYWSTFTSEDAAVKYLEERVSPSGECKLHINPKNPLQTELFGQGIKDKILY